MNTNGATATSPAELMTMFAERAARGDAAGLPALYEPEAVFEPQIGVTVALQARDEGWPPLARQVLVRPDLRGGTRSHRGEDAALGHLGSDPPGGTADRLLVDLGRSLRTTLGTPPTRPLWHRRTQR